LVESGLRAPPVLLREYKLGADFSYPPSEAIPALMEEDVVGGGGGVVSSSCAAASDPSSGSTGTGGEDEGEEAIGAFFSEEAHRAPDYEVPDVFETGRVFAIAQESRMHLGGRVWLAAVHMLRYFARCHHLATTRDSSDDGAHHHHQECGDLAVLVDSPQHRDEEGLLRWLRPVVLEMGSGTGLLGIGLADVPGGVLGEVRLTDKADLLPHALNNVWRWADGDAASKAVHVVTMELDWVRWHDDDYWSEGGAGFCAADGVDVVLAADCVYFEELYRPFVETLKRICNLRRRRWRDGLLLEKKEDVVCYLCNDDGRTAQGRATEGELTLMPSCWC